MIVHDETPAVRPGPVHTRPRRRRIAITTPGGLAALAATVLVAVAVLAALIVVDTGNQRDGLAAVGDRDAPRAAAATDLYFVLNDMDAQVANILLVGDATDLGFTAAQAQTIYDKRRLQADTDVQKAAVTATDPATAAAIRTLLDAYGHYEILTTRVLLLDALHPHPAGQAGADTIAAYRLAIDFLDTTLLPAAQALEDRSTAALESSYQQQHHRAAFARAAIVAAGIPALVLLIALQMYLSRRFRRRLNPAVLAATLALAVLATVGTLLPTAQMYRLDVAKNDAFDSIQALDQARAVSYDANADESRYLVDPARASQYQQAFLTNTLELVDLPGARIDTFDQDLATAINRYQSGHTAIGWTGLYGTEFRNITFPGERAAAEKTLRLFAVYQADDRRIRALVQAGQLQAAIALCTSYQPGQSNYAFDQYDQALAALIAINQNAFTANITAANRDLDGWTLIPWLILAAFTGLLAAGTWRRFAEYW